MRWNSKRKRAAGVQRNSMRRGAESPMGAAYISSHNPIWPLTTAVYRSTPARPHLMCSDGQAATYEAGVEEEHLSEEVGSAAAGGYWYCARSRSWTWR